MQFSISTLTISALLTSLTTATPLLPRTTETINITSLYVRNIDSSIISTEFVIQPNNITCSGSTPALNSSVACDTDKWSFAIAENALNNYLLSVYKETGLASGIYDQQNVTLICRAGGSSNTDYVCYQPVQESISMTLA